MTHSDYRKFRKKIESAGGPGRKCVSDGKFTKGKWIWIDPEAYPRISRSRVSMFSKKNSGHFGVVIFRKTFSVPERALAVNLIHTGDPRYSVFLNGKFIAAGPTEPGGDYGKKDPPDWWFAQVHDLTDMVRTGKNTVTFEACSQPLVQSDYSCGRPGIRFEIEIVQGDGSRKIIPSDSACLCKPDRSRIAPDFQDLTLRNETEFFPAWEYPENEPYRPPLETAGIPSLFTTELRPSGAMPLNVSFGKPEKIFLEFPYEITGYLNLTVTGASGTRIQIDYEELPHIPYLSETVILRDGRQTFRSLFMRAINFVELTVHSGTFYSSEEKDVVIEDVFADFVSYPMRFTGDFHCSDDGLNRIFDCCCHTLQLCRQRLHLDSPVHQEGLGCTADYMIQSMFNYYLTDDRELTKLDLIRTAKLIRQQKGKMFHTTFSLLWIEMLKDYCLFSGDTEILHEVIDGVRSVLGRFAGYVGREGLVSQAPDYMFIDWIRLGDFDLHHPPAQIGMGPVSMFYYGALKNARYLLERLGSNREARELAEKEKALKHAICKLLWDGRKGMFIDGLPGLTKVRPGKWLPPDRMDLPPTLSMQTNILAVYYRLTDEKTSSELLEKILRNKKLPPCQPYFYYYLFEGLRENGLFEKHGMDLIRKWTAAVREHPTSLKETWDGGDYCHAWGVAPAIAMFRSIAGITPAAEKFREADVNPRPCGLRSFQCRVPTPYGPITVEYENGKTSVRKPGSGCRL